MITKPYQDKIKLIVNHDTKKQLEELSDSDKDKLITQLREELSECDKNISKASHDLKNPLTSISLNLQIMLRKIKNSESEKVDTVKLIELIEHTETQTTRMTDLINSLLKSPGKNN